MAVNYCILRVYARTKPNKRTFIPISFTWFAKIGFVSGALACAVPHSDGFTLTLQNSENAGHVKTIRVGAGKRAALTVGISRDFQMPDLSEGDFLVAAYEYGKITARKLPTADKYYVVDTRNHNSYLRLNGGWLNETGFPPDTITIIEKAHGENEIIFSAWHGNRDEYPELVKQARKHKQQIMQTRQGDSITFIELFADVLNKVGLKNGDVAGIRCGQGKITLFKPSLTTKS